MIARNTSNNTLNPITAIPPIRGNIAVLFFVFK